MNKLVIASQNRGKLQEINDLLADLKIEVLSSKNAGYLKEIIENGSTFTENALIKARTVARATNLPVIADDSGICLKDLSDQPGIFSARWGEKSFTEKELAQFTLNKLSAIPNATRSAYFITIIAYINSSGEEKIFEGRVDGHIAFIPTGIARPNLAYDLIFIPNGYAKTFAEMTDDKKNQISHRGIALNKFKEFIINSYENNKSGL